MVKFWQDKTRLNFGGFERIRECKVSTKICTLECFLFVVQFVIWVWIPQHSIRCLWKQVVLL